MAGQNGGGGVVNLAAQRPGTELFRDIPGSALAARSGERAFAFLSDTLVQ
jgi:hypothetical protein